MNPKCPFCGSDSVFDEGAYFCATCGGEFDLSFACLMMGLSPPARAERIGDYHGRYGWGYLWCQPKMDREILRAYANGFLMAAPHDYLDGDQARRDAFGRD